MKRAWKVIMGCALLSGCTASGDPVGEDDDAPGTVEVALIEPGVGGIVSTYNPDVRLLSGYTSLFEQSAAECLDVAESEPAVTVGSMAEQFQLELVTSREDLAKRLGIDLGLKIKYGIGGADARFDLLDEWRGSERSVFFLLRAVQSYEVSNKRDVALSAASREQLLEDPRGFLSACGSHWVSGIRYEAQVFVALRFDASDEDAARQIKLGVGVSAGLPVISLDASVGVNLADQAKKSGASVTLDVASTGFLLSGTEASAGAVGAVLGGELDSNTVAKLDALRGEMAKSLLADACRDAGGAECDGPGYQANGVRNARVAALVLSPYAKIEGSPAPTADWNGWDTIRKSLKSVDRFVRDLSTMSLKMERAYVDEIALFLESPLADKARFGVAPPGATAWTMAELVARAGIWEEKFRPDDGSAVRAVQDVVSQCWSDASVGYFGSCAEGADPKTTAEYKAAIGELSTYKSTGRVLPLRFKSTAKSVKYAEAAGACGAMTADAAPMRLPSRAEAERLAIPVAYSGKPAPVPSTELYRVWHQGSPVCKKPEVNKDSSFYNPPGAGSTTTLDMCTEKGKMLFPALCVPAAGPFNVPNL